MTKLEVVRTALEGGEFPYVPWSYGFYQGAQKKLLGEPSLNAYSFPDPLNPRFFASIRVFIHSCGDVDDLFDDLAGISLDCARVS